MKAPAQGEKSAPSTKEVREEFRRHGVSVAKWADAKGFDPSLVKDVLAGRVKGLYGQAHEIAIALGLKPQPGRPPRFLEGHTSIDAERRRKRA